MANIGTRATNAVRFSHNDEHRVVLKGKILRRIRQQSGVLISHCQQQEIVSLLELQLLDLFADP